MNNVYSHRISMNFTKFLIFIFLKTYLSLITDCCHFYIASCQKLSTDTFGFCYKYFQSVLDILVI